ncbi:uncharacterized protein LOC128675067 [Plodia interpunctella]|uniref:uncharacterized protein LOC128675067 n=1 Tax=Plodia interpunctella TaxID=58824 RepID=UPI0023680D98|nr:uncharacterized protein LOC128675067 [Plodia interpunctella]
MNLIRISHLNILLVLIKIVYSENDDSYDQSLSNEQHDYDESKTHYHRLRHKKPKYTASNNMMPYANGYDYNYNDDSCVCSCDKCSLGKPCCRDFCLNCQAMNQPNLYYLNFAIPQYAPAAPQIPPLYPYPMDTPNSTSAGQIIFTTAQLPEEVFTTTTTPIPSPSPSRLSTTTEAGSPTPSTTTSDSRREAVIEVSDIYINENIARNNDAKYILTSLRRTKPYWQANRVVPIPNNLAEKLMTQMKDDTKPTTRRVYRSY